MTVAEYNEFGALKYHPVQADVMWDPVRFKVIPAGRRSGKTELAKRFTLRKALEPRKDHSIACLGLRRRIWAGQHKVVPEWDCDCVYFGYYDLRVPEPANYFFAAPTRDQAKTIYWTWLKNNVPPYALISKNESDLSMRIRSYGRRRDGTPHPMVMESTLSVRSMDRPERIEGSPWDGGILDEYANMKEEAYSAHVRPALADRRGWLWMIGVPEGINHYYDRYIAACSSETPDWAGYTWKSADILPEEEVESARRDLDPRTFRQEYEASFEEASGRVYYAFNYMRDVHEFTPKDYVGSPGCPLFIGVDFNVHPMTAVVGYNDLMVVDGNEHTFIFHEFELETSNTYEMAEALAEGRCTCCRGSHGLAFFPATVYPDASGASANTSTPKGETDHQILRDAGYKVVSHKANPFVRDRVNAVNTRFETGDGRRRMHVHPRCKRLIRALNGLLFTDKGEPDKTSGLDHITDALGYALHHLYPIVSGRISGIRF